MSEANKFCPDPERAGAVIGESGHRYPSAHPPGSHWATDCAWDILDTVQPGVIPDDVRFWLAGLIAGILMRERALRR